MFVRKKYIKKLENLLTELNINIARNDLIDFSEILGNWKVLLKRNFVAGIFKGIGIGIGFTIITAIIIYFLQKIVRLNIPIIGEYISDIIDIVERTR